MGWPVHFNVRRCELLAHPPRIGGAESSSRFRPPYAASAAVPNSSKTSLHIHLSYQSQVPSSEVVSKYRQHHTTGAGGYHHQMLNSRKGQVVEDEGKIEREYLADSSSYIVEARKIPTGASACSIHFDLYRKYLAWRLGSIGSRRAAIRVESRCYKNFPPEGFPLTI